MPILGDLYLLIPGAIVVLFEIMVGILVSSSFGLDSSLARIRTDQILEFGWRILLPLAVLQVVLAGIYRLYLFDPTAMKDTDAGGWAWDAFGIPMLVPIVTTIVWLESSYYSSTMRIRVEIPSVCSMSTQKSLRNVCPGTGVR